MPRRNHIDNGPMVFLDREPCPECSEDMVIEENDFYVFFTCTDYKHCGYEEVDEK